MKKILVLAMIAMLSLGITGCGNDAEKPAAEATVTPTATVTATPTPTVEEDEAEDIVDDVEEVAGEAIDEEAIAETDAATSGNDAMDAYIKLSQATFDTMTESLEGIMEFKASGEGNTLKYEMKILADMGDDETAKAEMDAEMESQDDDMQMVVEGLKAAGIEDPKFIVEYSDKDGDIIATYTFE